MLKVWNVQIKFNYKAKLSQFNGTMSRKHQLLWILNAISACSLKIMRFKLNKIQHLKSKQLRKKLNQRLMKSIMKTLTWKCLKMSLKTSLQRKSKRPKLMKRLLPSILSKSQRLPIKRHQLLQKTKQARKAKLRIFRCKILYQTPITL